MLNMNYKQVRLHKDYLEKLQKLSDKNKRSMSRTLEILIDGVLE